MCLQRLGEPCGPIHPGTRNDNRMGERDNVCLCLGALLWPLELSLSPAAAAKSRCGVLEPAHLTAFIITYPDPKDITLDSLQHW